MQYPLQTPKCLKTRYRASQGYIRYLLRESLLEDFLIARILTLAPGTLPQLLIPIGSLLRGHKPALILVALSAKARVEVLLLRDVAALVAIGHKAEMPVTHRLPLR